MARRDFVDKKIWWVEYRYTAAERAKGDLYSRLTWARAVRLDEQSAFEVEGDNVARELFEGLNNRGAKLAFVYDIGFFGLFCDYYALKRGLPHYNDAAKNKSTAKASTPAEECYNILFAAGRGVIDFKLTLKRTAKTHEYGSGHIGGLHTVEYRGLSLFFPTDDRESVERDFGINSGDKATDGARLLKAVLTEFSNVVGENALSADYMSHVYTVGGAARRFYLRERYGEGGTLRRYQKEHSAEKGIDFYFRSRRLNLGGMCFFPTKNKQKLIEKQLFKYDVNGLYSATANTCGELSLPRETTLKEFELDRSIDKVYIIVVKDFLAFRKMDMPNVFADPSGGGVGDVVQVEGEWAIFRELWDILKKFYDFEEFEVCRVFVCEKHRDPAIYRYNSYFSRKKIEAEREGRPVQRQLAKMFLNSLVGKFLQRTSYVEIKPQFNLSLDMVEFVRGDLVDNWEKAHFDYIRGSYIYIMARVRVMNDMLTIFESVDNPAEHHFYTDTDSIVTDLPLPSGLSDGQRLGFYKVEKKYSHFGVIGKKVYYGRDPDGRDELTAAGIKKGTVFRQLTDSYGEGLSPSEIWDILNSPVKWEVWKDSRVSGGGVKSKFLVSLTEINIDKGD